MSQVYYEPRASDKIIAGVIAGLLGGAVAGLFLLLVDALFLYPGRWWQTPSAVAGLFYGSPESNVATANAAFPVGLLVHFLLFALAGIGFVYYRPLFRKFKIPMVVGGAIYGLITWLLLFLFLFNAIRPSVLQNVNIWAVLVGFILGGATIGYWLGRPDAVKRLS